MNWGELRLHSSRLAPQSHKILHNRFRVIDSSAAAEDCDKYARFKSQSSEHPPPEIVTQTRALYFKRYAASRREIISHAVTVSAFMLRRRRTTTTRARSVVCMSRLNYHYSDFSRIIDRSNDPIL